MNDDDENDDDVLHQEYDTSERTSKTRMPRYQ